LQNQTRNNGPRRKERKSKSFPRLERAPPADSRNEKARSWRFDEYTKSTRGVFWSIVDGRSSVSAFVGLARSKKLHYAGFVASGVSPPTRYLLFQLRIKILSTFLSTKDDA